MLRIPIEDIIIPAGGAKEGIMKYLTPDNIGTVLAYLIVAGIIVGLWKYLPKWILVVGGILIFIVWQRYVNPST